MIRVLRALLTIALITTGVNNVAAEASPRPAMSPPAGPRVQLGAVNVLSGKSTGYVRVSLARDATIAVSEPDKPGAAINKDITVDGRGRFVGLALVEDPYPGYRDYNRFFMAGRFGGCDERGCKTTNEAVETMFEASKDAGARFVVKAGEYRLYLLADGAPVKVTFRLHGLRGKRTLRSTVAATEDLKTSPTRVDLEPGGGRVWSAGSSFDGGQVGFSFSSLVMKAADFTGTEVGICQYNAFHPPPEQMAYGPHCSELTPALGSGGRVKFDSDIDSDTFSLIATFGYHDNKDGTVGAPNLSGQHGLGAWIRSPQDLEVHPFRSFFLTIE